MYLGTIIFLQVAAAVFFGFGVLGHEFYFDDNGQRDFGIHHKRLGGIPEEIEATSDNLEWAQPLSTATWITTLFLVAWDLMILTGGDVTFQNKNLLTVPKVQ